MSSIGVQAEYVTGKTKAENILEDFYIEDFNVVHSSNVAVLIMSGCGARTPAPYIEKYVSKNVDLNKNQIDDKIVVTKRTCNNSKKTKNV
jgi:hypothetical protein